MIEYSQFPRKIFIEKGCQDYAYTQKILSTLKRVPWEMINDEESMKAVLETKKDPVGEGKQYLYLTRQKGDFIKPCPCTPHYLGCNYYIINLDLNCPLNCSYCILQHYLSHPFITIHVNTDELWSQLDAFLEKNNRPLRIGTGELGDSLVLDHITERSRDLIAYFRNKPQAVLELKTKTVNIDNIIKTEPAANIVIAWSINTPKVAKSEEKGAPQVKARILAAQAVIQRGYRVAFHLDPIIRYPGWEHDYAELIEFLLEKIPADKIAWISLGSLRYPPQLKNIIIERFPLSDIVYEEFIRGKDGKYRYFKPLRIDLYGKIVDFIRKQKGKNIPLYFCMESKDIWRKVLKKEPRGEEEIEKFLSSPLGSEKRPYNK